MVIPGMTHPADERSDWLGSTPMTRDTNRFRSRAFSLVEILIVVVILGILAAIVVPQFTTAANDARSGNIATQVQTIENQLELYKARNGSYPTLAQLNAPTAVVMDAQGNPYQGWGILIDGHYIKSPPLNPYTNGFRVARNRSADWQYDQNSGRITAVTP